MFIRLIIKEISSVYHIIINSKKNKYKESYILVNYDCV